MSQYASLLSDFLDYLADHRVVLADLADDGSLVEAFTRGDEYAEEFLGTYCPRCGEHRLQARATLPALSRVDNRTYVCSSCGVDEAFRDLGNQDPDHLWPGYPGRMDHQREDHE